MPEPRAPETEPTEPASAGEVRTPASEPAPKETGGRASGPDPTRYGDWEKNGRCIDF